MEKLWSPWRSQYIDTFKEEKEPLPGSLFTRILAENDDRKNYLLYRGKTCFIIMNLYPYNSGHLMIVPYKEARELAELDEETRLEMFALLELGTKGSGLAWSLALAYRPPLERRHQFYAGTE